MNKIGIGIVFLVLLGAAIIVMTKMTKSEEPYQTRLYCFDNTADIRDDLLSSLVQVSEESGFELRDYSSDVSRDLSSLDVPVAAAVLDGVIRQEGTLLATFSNLGSNNSIFHMSFYTDDYERISDRFDSAVREAATPFRAKTISGGAFDDSFCKE